MAKNAKSGLGRGLNSLLGGSYEASPTKEPEQQPTEVVTERVIVDADDMPAYEATITTRPAATSPSVTSPIAPKGALSSQPRQTTTSTSQVSRVHVPIEDIEPIYRDESKEPTQEPQKEQLPATDEVPLELISPNPDQPRTNFKKEEIEELAASIERDGLLQPILVRKLPDGHYQIIAGERRYQACKTIGLELVPIRIKEADDVKSLELALIENLQRSDLNPIEEAYGYKRLMERNNMTQADVARAMSKGRSTIANALRLLELPEEAQQLLFEDKITAGHARAVLSIPSKEGRQKLTKKLLEDNISVREAESYARLLAGKTNSDKAPREPIPASYKSFAKALRDVLKTNVRVKSVKGKNKIEIEFKDERELERLFNELVETLQ